MLEGFIAIIFLLLLSQGGFQWIYNFIIGRNDGNWLILDETTHGQLQKHVNKYSQLTWHSHIVAGYSFAFDKKSKRLIHFRLDLMGISVDSAESYLDSMCGHNWTNIMSDISGTPIFESSKGTFVCSVKPNDIGVEIHGSVN